MAPSSWSRWSDRWWRAGALSIVIAPILVAGCRALIRGFSPIGDNGILAVRARDVLTRHHPLLGSWTSASIASGQPVNNPGPLYFDLIAVPVKLLGPSVGLVLGVMLVNVAAVSFAVVTAQRLAGRTAMLALTVAVVVLEWSMGSELLFDVWQPNALVLPGLAFMVSAWGVACGRAWFLPWAVGLGSLLVQTHLSYVYLVPIAILGAAATAAATRSVRGDLRRPLAATAVVALVAWAQPIVEQFASSGQGNISSLIEASRQETDRIGARLGARLLAEVVATPPFIGRPSYSDAVPGIDVIGNGDNVPVIGFTAAVATLVMLVALVAGTVWWHRRRDEPATAALGITVLIVLAACLVTLAVMPVGAVGLSSHQMRWLWAVGALAVATLLCAAVPAVRSVLPRTAAEITLAAVGAVVAVLSLPTHVSPTGPTAARDSLPIARRLGSHLDAVEQRGTVLFDTSTLAFAEPYSGYLYAAMQDRGIPFVFETDGLVRQFGERRRYRGDADVRIWLVRGTAALEEPLRQGVERIALVRGLDDEETAELARLERRLRQQAGDTGLALNAAGRDAVRAGRLPATALDPEPGQHPFEAIGDLNLAVDQGWIDLSPRQAGAYQRLVELRTRQFLGTLAVLAAPVDIRPET